MKFKKFAVILLSAAMGLTTLAGCSSNSSATNSNATTNTTETTTSQTTETKQITFPLETPATVSVLAYMSQEYQLKDNIVMQTALGNANITFDYIDAFSSSLKEKRNLLLASGDYPDIFLAAGLKTTELNKYGSEGVLIPLEDLIREYAPNLTAVLDEKDGWQYITAPDGHVYSTPNIYFSYGAMNSYWINKKWMDNLGLKEPTSYDELYEVLKAFKEQDANGNGDPNDEIAYTANTSYTTELLLAYADFGYDYETKTALVDGELTYIPTTDSFKEYIAFITKLYQEGIMDKNAFTQTIDQQRSLGQTADIYGSFVDDGAFVTVGRDNGNDYIILTPFQEGTYPNDPGINPGCFAITDACEIPEIMVAWIDQFYSQEGGILAYMGVEDKTYEVYDDGTWGWIVGTEYGEDISEVRAGNTFYIGPPALQPDYWYNMTADADPCEVYLNGERKKIRDVGAVPLPMLNYTEEQNKEISAMKPIIDDYISQYTAQVVTGELDLNSSWDSYVSTMNAMGAERLEELYKEVYAAAIQ
jgi:putative aldouronate transport system substrate-binding protein